MNHQLHSQMPSWTGEDIVWTTCGLCVRQGELKDDHISLQQIECVCVWEFFIDGVPDRCVIILLEDNSNQDVKRVREWLKVLQHRALTASNG